MPKVPASAPERRYLVIIENSNYNHNVCNLHLRCRIFGHLCELNLSSLIQRGCQARTTEPLSNLENVGGVCATFDCHVLMYTDLRRPIAGKNLTLITYFRRTL
jgi:hypothetical protein